MRASAPLSLRKVYSSTGAPSGVEPNGSCLICRPGPGPEAQPISQVMVRTDNTSGIQSMGGCIGWFLSFGVAVANNGGRAVWGSAFLSVVGCRTVFAAKVLVEQGARDRGDSRVDTQRFPGQSGQVFEDN